MGIFARNVAYNLLGAGIPIVLMIATIPPYLKVLGEARYGLLSLIWLLFGYFGLFDFGLSRATANELARLRFADPQKRADVFYTALMLNAGLGILAGLVFYLGASPLLSSLASSASFYADEIIEALPWVAVLFPVTMIGAVMNASLEAEERFLIYNFQQLVGATLSQCFPLFAVLLYGPSLRIAVMGAVGARVISLFWTAWTSITFISKDSRPRIKFDHLPSLLRYGGWVTASNALGPVLWSADQFVIARLIGPVAVAHYSVPFNLAVKASLVSNALTRTLFPRLSGLNGVEASHLVDKSILTLSWVMALICAPSMFLVDFGLTIWVGRAFAAAATPIAQIILAGIWISGIASVPACLLQARGRPELMVKYMALESIPYFILLWVSIKALGLPGAAYAFNIRIAAEAALLFWAIGKLRERLCRLALPGTIVFASWIIAVLFPARPVVAFGEAFLLALIILASMIAIDPQIRALLRAVEQRFFYRAKFKVPD